jgi:hypothetical protein
MSTRQGRILIVVSFAVLGVLHLALTIYFEPMRLLFADEPLGLRDFFTHAEQAWRVTDALAGWGRTWAYDVQLLAGYPSGTIFNADNKAWELVTFALWKAGLPRGTAFNMFVLLSHLLVPLVVVASARLVGLGWRASLVALAMAMGLWFFDSLVHTCHWIGMNAFAIAGYLFLLPIALIHRIVHDGRWWHGLLLAVILPIGHLVHPYIFLVLALPMIAVYARAFPTLTPGRHLLVWLAIATTIAANIWWIVIALRFWHYVLDAGYFGSSTLSYVLSDYLGILRDPTVTGNMENRTALRVLVSAAAVAGLVSWWRNKDDRALPFTMGLVSLFLLIYLGGYLWLTRQIQPYRFLLPFSFLAVIPAAGFFDDLVESGVLARIPRLGKIALAILALTALPHFVRDVLYFMPVLVPDPPELAERKPAGERMDTAVLQRQGPPFRRAPTTKDFVDVAKWLRKNHSTGRVLVEKPELGEYLLRATDLEILGGFQLRNLQHSAANLFRRHPDGDMTDEKLVRYLEDYAVSFLVITRKMPDLELRPDIFEPLFWIPPHRIYGTKTKVNYLEKGHGTVKASMNRIEVSHTYTDEEIVLRFHWIPTMDCFPDCRVEQSPTLNDPVGFIRVLAPHPETFVVENAY